MDTLTVKIELDEQGQTFTKDFVDSPSSEKTAAELTEGDGLVIELGSGWPTDSYICQVRIDQIENGVTTTLTNWTPPSPAIVRNENQKECFEISPNAPTESGPNNSPNSAPGIVTLQDTESLRFGSDAFEYKVWVDTINGTYEADPEVINKSGEDVPQWVQPTN